MQPFLRGFRVLQELTPSCIQQNVGGGWEVLHSSSLTGVVTKQWQKPRQTCLYKGGKTVCSGQTPNSVSAALQWKFSFLLQKISIIWEGVIIPTLSSIADQSHSKSLPVVSEPRGEADRFPCHQMVYFCFLSCYCWRSAGNFICREEQDRFNTANMLLEPAHNQCECSGLVHRYELQLKSCTLQGKRSRLVSATRVKFGWRGEKWSDGFLFFSIRISHTVAALLWYLCMDWGRCGEYLVLMWPGWWCWSSDKSQRAWWEGRLHQNT